MLSSAEQRVIFTRKVKAGKLFLTYSEGNLEVSSDLISWKRADVTEAGKYEEDIPLTGKKFFRVAP